ncbi:hydantoinase B/oxoprolinase family protein [Arundinibacter roseus]|uniref:5-oxoprolinase n=1 Tax=Arundinibacter roseus TaxID=2070510 RepID=A0A4R4KK43_9BACT|nr:hydantoinase B/oxoprolinase family protein [Arundinibacter roseus]TDB67039.1 5-oxoprolinase [Arundinibacter roseus]
MTPTNSWQILIDTGGTFTDCLGLDPAGKKHRIKVLSSSSLRGKITRKINPYVYSFEAPWSYDSRLLEGYTLQIPSRNIQTKVLSIDYKNQILTLEENIPALVNQDFDLTTHEEAPVLAIRLLTATPLGSTFPPIDLRLGTTIGTNALLERKGAKTLLITTKGFKDILPIGTQQRPHLFQLDIPTIPALQEEVFEINERIDALGNVLIPLNERELLRLRDFLIQNSFQSIAISLLNAYKNPSHEQAVADYLSKELTCPLSVSTSLSPNIHFLRRTQTTVVDAYLAPVIKSYLHNIESSLGSAAIQVMTSAGGLLGSEKYLAKDSLLSGPAGGMTAALSLAKQLGYRQLLTFDMGGTSTDTARFDDSLPLTYLTRINGMEIANPALAIETVAAGGGSVCWFDGFTLQVGPQSAGAKPGPACYGAGGPLTITDVNLLLSKLDTSQFEIPIQPTLAWKALNDLLELMEELTGNRLTELEVLQGFERIANEKMAEAIRKISVAQGEDPSEYALMTFGGAGGLHGCQLAELLGCTEVIIPFEAGLFSAAGMGVAALNRLATRQILMPWNTVEPKLSSWLKEMKLEVTELLNQDGVWETETAFCSIFLRFQGQETPLEVAYSGPQTLDRFYEDYKKLYGYLPENKQIEVESIRLMGREKKRLPEKIQRISYSSSPPAPRRTLTNSVFSTIHPVYQWSDLDPAKGASGPCIITGEHSTTFVPESWAFCVQPSLDIILKQERDLTSNKVVDSHAEEIELELFTNRFKGIAEEMGVHLQRTAFSVNVKERLDFSCALLDPEGELLVNAPHIPVHLGSLGVCARLILERLPIGPGDVVLTNHPKYGGSHLPDVTMLAGVFTDSGQLVGYVINRAHHAEIGGTRPGSMPPNAHTLQEEGVVILPQYLVKVGKLEWENIRSLFLNGPYPSRMWAENEADIVAALSSLRKGQAGLLNLVGQFGEEKILSFMKKLKENAYLRLQQALDSWEGKTLSATEFLDDGHRISVKISLKKDALTFDFTNTSKVHPNNLNANLSIIHSALLYVLRLLVNREIPLNDGLMKNVTIILPENTLLHPDFQDDPAACPAVVGGNTEVSQRLVDTLLKAFGLAACSQGTMNNFLFGNETLGYYETIGGGCGAGPGFHGHAGIHQHMTNTRITDVEELERRYPVQMVHFGIRENSGGSGQWKGGDGLIREFEFLETLDITILGQHRHFAPYGLAGGSNGKSADQTIFRKSGSIEKCPGICSTTVQPGDRIRLETPGGGGYGDPALSI